MTRNNKMFNTRFRLHICNYNNAMTDFITKKTKITTGESSADSSQTVGYIIYLLAGILETLLIFRLIFKLTGANPESNFVNIIYSPTQIFIEPFAGIFPQATTQGVTTTAVLEPATLVAIVVYALLTWGIIQVFRIIFRRLQ